MADTSQQELSEPQTNGLIDDFTEEEKSKMRPADIDADMREMERRKRVEMMMNSRLFREELERIIETQMKDGAGPSGLLQQISEMMGAQGARFNTNMFKNSNCVVPINDIRGVESMGYAKGEKLLRCKLAAVFRLLDLYGWTQGVGGQITARLNQDQEHFLINPYGLLYHEVTASSLIKVDMQGSIVEQGTTNFGVHITGFQLHSTIHAARPDIKCIIHITTPSVIAVSALKCGLLSLGQESIVIGEVSTHQYSGGTFEPEEREKITRNLGPINKVMFLTNRGALCCGETVEEAFFNVYNTVLACETQLKLMPAGLDNLYLISEESKKTIFESSRKPPVPQHSSVAEPSPLAEKLEKRWRIGGTDFEALMRMLDNAGFRTGYIYRHPLIKGEPPRPRNDVEVPPAVSSLGYLLEEEELYKQGLWKGGRKGTDRTRWLNSPNVYQKVEILETGTPDPKKITKWVSDGSPTHSSTPVRIEGALQFVPKNTNPKEFKQLQQQIKDYRRADKISAGPQSHILEGVTWDEAKKMQDATISGAGEQVVLVGAASKGIIQRGFQHNAMVYKTPYAKNPFDTITDQELDQYKKEIERKQKGDPYDESQSESEALSSFNISRATHESSTAKSPIQSPVSVTSETEEESRDEPRVLRIETKQVPAPSQPEVVLSDDFRSSSSSSENDDRGCEWQVEDRYDDQRLDVVRSTVVAEPMKPVLIDISSAPVLAENVRILEKANLKHCPIVPAKPRPYVSLRRAFFEDFDRRAKCDRSLIENRGRYSNLPYRRRFGTFSDSGTFTSSKSSVDCVTGKINGWLNGVDRSISKRIEESVRERIVARVRTDVEVAKVRTIKIDSMAKVGTVGCERRACDLEDPKGTCSGPCEPVSRGTNILESIEIETGDPKAVDDDVVSVDCSVDRLSSAEFVERIDVRTDDRTVLIDEAVDCLVVVENAEKQVEEKENLGIDDDVVMDHWAGRQSNGTIESKSCVERLAVPEENDGNKFVGVFEMESSTKDCNVNVRRCSTRMNSPERNSNDERERNTIDENANDFNEFVNDIVEETSSSLVRRDCKYVVEQGQSIDDKIVGEIDFNGNQFDKNGNSWMTNTDNTEDIVGIGEKIENIIDLLKYIENNLTCNNVNVEESKENSIQHDGKNNDDLVEVCSNDDDDDKADRSSAEEMIVLHEVLERAKIDVETHSIMLESTLHVDGDDLEHAVSQKTMTDAEEPFVWLTEDLEARDSIKRVIDSLLMNVGPSRTSSLDVLPGTDISVKYNLDSTNMSLIYSLTPTMTDTEEYDRRSSEGGTPGFLERSFERAERRHSMTQNGNADDSIHDEESEFIWQDLATNAKHDDVDVATRESNGTVNNSLQVVDSSLEDAELLENCSNEGSDILELPASTVRELKETGEESFNNDISKTASQIIADLDDIEIYMDAFNLVDEILYEVSCLTLAGTDDRKEFQGAARNGLRALNVAAKIVDDLVVDLPCYQALNGDDIVDEDASVCRDDVVVIDELVHHVIDRFESDESIVESSSEVYNTKRVKETTNIELKELQNSCKGDVDVVRRENVESECSTMIEANDRDEVQIVENDVQVRLMTAENSNVGSETRETDHNDDSMNNTSLTVVDDRNLVSQEALYECSDATDSRIKKSVSDDEGKVENDRRESVQLFPVDGTASELKIMENGSEYDETYHMIIGRTVDSVIYDMMNIVETRQTVDEDVETQGSTKISEVFEIVESKEDVLSVDDSSSLKRKHVMNDDAGRYDDDNSLEFQEKIKSIDETRSGTLDSSGSDIFAEREAILKYNDSDIKFTSVVSIANLNIEVDETRKISNEDLEIVDTKEEESPFDDSSSTDRKRMTNADFERYEVDNSPEFQENKKHIDETRSGTLDSSGSEIFAEREATLESTDSDTKSDGSMEKHRVPKIHFCLIEYVGEVKDRQEITEEETQKENKPEESSYVQFEEVDTVIPPNILGIRCTCCLEVKKMDIAGQCQLPPIYEETNEVTIEVPGVLTLSDRKLLSIPESADEIQSSGDPEEEDEEATAGTFDSKASSPSLESSKTMDYFSCKDDSNSTTFQSSQSILENSLGNGKLNSDDPEERGEAKNDIDDEDSEKLDATYTISDDSEGESQNFPDLTYNADVSTNVDEIGTHGLMSISRKSDSSMSDVNVTNCDRCFDTTVNMADVSYSESEKTLSTLKKIKRTRRRKRKNNNNDKAEIIEEDSKEKSDCELDDVIFEDIVEDCMTHSYDTTEFLRLERALADSGDNNNDDDDDDDDDDDLADCELVHCTCCQDECRRFCHDENSTSLTALSPLKALPKYEDTTLCRVISRINLTDTMSTMSDVSHVERSAKFKS